MVLATPVLPRSVGLGQPDDRKGPVSFLLVASVTRLACRDPIPGPRALVSVELRGGHPVLLAAEFDPDLIGGGGDVVVPGWVAGGSARGRADQPDAAGIREPADRGLALLAALGAHCRQVEQVHAHELVT